MKKNKAGLAIKIQTYMTSTIHYYSDCINLSLVSYLLEPSKHNYLLYNIPLCKAILQELQEMTARTILYKTLARFLQDFGNSFQNHTSILQEMTMSLVISCNHSCRINLLRLAITKTELYRIMKVRFFTR